MNLVQCFIDTSLKLFYPAHPACLRDARVAVENEALRASIRSAAIASMTLALLGACFSATAQYQDRDTRGVPKTSASAPPPEARTDINHATVNELLKVPGMTPSWAGRIMRFRPYRTKADLLDWGIVTNEVYDRIKDYVIAHRDKQ